MKKREIRQTLVLSYQGGRGALVNKDIYKREDRRDIWVPFTALTGIYLCKDHRTG